MYTISDAELEVSSASNHFKWSFLLAQYKLDVDMNSSDLEQVNGVCRGSPTFPLPSLGTQLKCLELELYSGQGFLAYAPSPSMVLARRLGDRLPVCNRRLSVVCNNIQ